MFVWLLHHPFPVFEIILRTIPCVGSTLQGHLGLTWMTDVCANQGSQLAKGQWVVNTYWIILRRLCRQRGLPLRWATFDLDSTTGDTAALHCGPIHTYLPIYSTQASLIPGILDQPVEPGRLPGSCCPLLERC